MIFNKESDFEEALIKILSEKGWEKEVLKNYSEQDLLQNWARVIRLSSRSKYTPMASCSALEGIKTGKSTSIF